MERDKVVWISHRGYHESCVENTASAFDAARDAGFTHLETDLRSTLDGHIILHHDSSLAQTCGQNLKLEAMRLSEVRRQRTHDGQPLLTFEEFVQRYAGCNWTFDIKPESALRTLHILKNWVHRKNAESWLNSQARFLLWSRSAEQVAQQLFPQITVLAQRRECYRAGLSVLCRVGSLGGLRRGRSYSLPRYFMGFDLYTPRIVEAYHRRGTRLLAYLPASPDDAKAAIAAGYDEILTNGLPLQTFKGKPAL